MKNNHELEKHVDQTLTSLDNLQQLEANEFLHAKVLHRMQVLRQSGGGAQKLMLRMAGVLCLFICLNTVSYFILKQPTNTTTKNIKGADAFADAYGLNNNLNSY